MGKIIVVGLGAGDIEQLPLGVYRLLKEQKHPIFLRTQLHPVVDILVQEGLIVHSFDDVYENQSQFEDVYQEIVRCLITAANKEDIVYAVPGHPLVAERTVHLLLENKENSEVEIKGGKSFLDDLFQAVHIDPVEGFQLLDAMELHEDQIDSGQHLILMQVFDQYTASDAKLTLMEKYPDEHQVALVHAAGTSQQQVDWLPLFEIDRMQGIHNLTSLYVPPLALDDRSRAFATAQAYMDAITGEGGDVWVKQQTHESLVPYLREEVSELISAVEAENMENMIEELGDILMQILYHTSLGEQAGYFSLEDVLDMLNKKLRRRHPHVFDGVEARTVEEVDALWQKIKTEEKRDF